ncbi:MAG TPA: carboxypeptidase-like regulatory domain-containing protein [Candidatus Acidoferrum sp.]|jgi:hypothetical protein|nr:carboxypeptidase-like regulatory domain-containing protein [Candidatus Acidoferrum sp.]
MSPLRTEHKVTIGAAVIGAVAVVIAALIQGVIPWIHDSRPKRYVNGIVTDAVTKTPIPGVIVHLQTNEGKALSQDTSDRDGKFNLATPEGLVAMRLFVDVDGYVPYDEKLPADGTKNDIRLVRQHIRFGVPDGTPLDSARQILAGKLNVTVVFAMGCSKRATGAALNGGELDGDPRMPDAILKDLVNRVKDNSHRYDIITIEAGKRYEVRCF